MNSIYKVIWSKAKNCYVVASEIAKSHTKSASGQSVRRSALASLLALSFLCGGLGVASAADVVKVDVSTTSTTEVYTKEGTESYVEHALTHFDTKPEVDAKIDAKIEALKTTGDVATNKDNIAELQRKTQKIDYDAANDTTSVNGMKVGQQVDMGGKNLTNVGTINDIDLGTKEGGNYISQDGSIWGNMKNVDTQVGTNAVAIAGNTTAIAALDTKVGTVGTGDYLDPTKSIGENLGLLDAGLKQEVADRKAAIGELAVDGNYIEKGKNVSDNLVKLDNQAKANADEIVKTNERTGGIARNTEKTQTTIEGIVKVDNQGNVKDVKGLSAETINTTGDATIGGDLKVAGTITTDKMVFGDKATNNYTEIDHGKVTSKNLEVNGAGETISSSSTFNAKENKVGFANSATGEQSLHKQTSDVITDNVKNNITGDQSFHKQTSDIIMDNVKDLHNSNNRTQTKTETKDIITDKDGNSSTTSQTASENKTYLKDKDGKNTNSTIDTAKGYDKTIKGENGQTSTKQDELNITNTAEQGTIKNDAMNIENNATGDMTNNVGGKLTTTVTGQATENFNGGLDTNVTGKENHTVTGDQENTIGGNQTTTVEGNVKEDYKKDLTTTVGGNELHEVTGTKTENVTGMVKENYSNGQETNVTGNQDIHVSENQTNKIDGNQANTIGGDQTTNVTGDISNKAENITNEANTKLTDKVGENTRVLDREGITDTVPGADGKGSTFKQRIDAIMGNVKTDACESEVTQKGDEITSVVGKGEATISRVTQKKGSLEAVVTDGTSFNHSRDIAVASTKTLTGYGKMNQLLDDLDSSTKTITDGTHKTSKVQTALDITNTAADGTITNDAKNIVNNAQDTITNTAGTKITDTAGDSTVTTENGKGTTFTKRGSMAYRDGGPTDTNISGNTINTGKVTMDYAEVMKDLSVGGNATITGDVTARSYKVGRNTYIDENGINANNQKITNVADGSISEGSKDAVNGGQLYGVKRDLEHQVDKVGANAAAMANLRPMEFDPSSKWNIAAAIGNYGSETAAALGAFYRPNDDVMVNLSTAFGTGENMVGGGVSVRLGKGGNKLSREETNALKAQVADLSARMDALLSVLNPNMSKDFPDVPENHWAYEAVSRLAGNDIVQGYPDGEFHGERTMTRYEMAEIIYNALSRGAEAERELVEEFKPELQAMAASEKATAEKAEG